MRRPEHLLVRWLQILLIVVAVAVVILAVLIIFDMDESSRSQGGRFYVAVAAIVVLVAVETQFGKLVRRRLPFSIGTPPQYRRYLIISVAALGIVSVFLLGLAFYMP